MLVKIAESDTIGAMDADAYVKSIVDKYALNGRSPQAVVAAQTVFAVIQTWAGKWLLEVQYSGSNAKGTAIRGVADLDLFISLDPDTPETLSDIYNKLANHAQLQPYAPRRQNVSIGVTCNGYSIDLVPGKKQPGNTTDHSLYRSKAGTWTKTNVAKHIAFIQNSQRLDEIRALKIWRARHGLEFPSFYLEMTVIKALCGKRTGNIASNVWTVLEYLRGNFASTAVTDPANSNNLLSDDLTVTEKKVVIQKATSSLNQQNWGQIIW